MRSIESEGDSVDEATARALAALGVARDDVTLEVLSDGPGRARVRAIVSRETAESGVRAAEVLREIVSHLVADARVEVSEARDGTIVLSVLSEDGGSIIGRHGQTLDALEHLVNRILFQEGGPTARVAIDVEGYRERREESLRELAQRLARKATDSGEIVTVNAMTARDRRTVHLALRDHADVTTQSEGEGSNRRLLIVPKDVRRR